MAEKEPPMRIYCSAGGGRFSAIAVEEGFAYGACLPGHVSLRPVMMADQNWKHPNRAAYMKYLARERPALATVLDWERPEQEDEVLSWAAEAAQHVTEAVIVIPKVVGGVARLPQTIGGRQVRLGYPTTTSFGASPTPLWEFRDWPNGVHILGGQPHKQLQLARYLDARSCDGTFIRTMALRLAVWSPRRVPWASNHFWPTLSDLGVGELGRDAVYEAFRRSCVSVQAAWARWPA